MHVLWGFAERTAIFSFPAMSGAHLGGDLHIPQGNRHMLPALRLDLPRLRLRENESFCQSILSG